MRRHQPAAEQAAHSKSGPRRRPPELVGSLVTHEDFRRTTHANCSPIFPARFKGLVTLVSARIDEEWFGLSFDERVVMAMPMLRDRSLGACAESHTNGARTSFHSGVTRSDRWMRQKL